ncbi:hypothetical protein BDW66DRAFT_164004 [Aspergillus desertorum]
MSKPLIRRLGDPIKYNPSLYSTFSSHFTVLRPSLSELRRDEFLTALRENRFGSFHALIRPEELASAGAGFDWVDTQYLAEKRTPTDLWMLGILYCNGAAASSESVADMTLFLILASLRNLAWTLNPAGHSLGIIGMGQIGCTIAKKVYAAFGMRILYHDIVRKSEELERSVDAMFFHSLEDMLAESDCVVVATPFAGKALLTAELFARFKRGSRFVNIARGSLVDEEALLGALENGILVGVGMDVHADEANVHPRLASHPKVMMMSHNAGGTVDTHIRFERLAMENILAFSKEGRALTPVNAHLVKSKSVL